MELVSKFWYSKMDIPDEMKNEIKGMVCGEIVDTLNFSGLKKKLLRIDGTSFRKIFVANREFLYKGEFTAPSDENDYMNSQNYVTEDGLAGFSITSTGWLVSLYSNYGVGGFAQAVRSYVMNGAYKLVCIVSVDMAELKDSEKVDLNNCDKPIIVPESVLNNSLIRLYQDVYGFKIYARTINDTAIMRKYYGDNFIDSFVANNGTPFHIFMIGGEASGDYDSVRMFDDYFDAEAFVERSVKA